MATLFHQSFPQRYWQLTNRIKHYIEPAFSPGHVELGEIKYRIGPDGLY